MLTHLENEKKFTWEQNGVLSFIGYHLNGNEYVLSHSEVPREHRGKGIGKQLVESTFEYIERNGIQSFATCPFIKKVAKENERWHGVIGF